MRNLYVVLILGVLTACGNEEQLNNPEGSNEDTLIEVVEIDTTPLFDPIESFFGATEFLLPEGFTYEIIFQEEVDLVTRADGKKFPAKGTHDLSVFIPDEEFPETKGQLYISHETKYANADLGDGGGGTIFDIELIDGEWEVTSEYYHIDFSGVGGTNRNCGGSLTPNGTIFTCEEAWAWNTAYLYKDGKGHTDTTWRNGRPLWQNIGYIVEVDPKEKRAIAKHWGMGKYVHEDAHCTEDGKHVYLTDDNSPGGFYKYETETPYDYSTGQLYAYQQSEDGESGTWLKMPMDTNSLVYCTETAIGLGATMFVRHEWLEMVDGKLYINETGEDHFSFEKSIAAGGTVPNYLRKDFNEGGDNFDDAFGRVLCFDPETNKMESYLEGGFFSDSSGCFSNPDCNTSVTFGGRTYLVLSEDINWYDRGRAGEWGEENRNFINEIYFLDLSIENPTVDDLMRFGIAPVGAETTGVIFLPDGTMVVNLQHPSTSNPSPLNKSCTALVKGFNK